MAGLNTRNLFLAVHMRLVCSLLRPGALLLPVCPAGGPQTAVRWQMRPAITAMNFHVERLDGIPVSRILRWESRGAPTRHTWKHLAPPVKNSVIPTIYCQHCAQECPPAQQQTPGCACRLHFLRSSRRRGRAGAPHATCSPQRRPRCPLGISGQPPAQCVRLPRHSAARRPAPAAAPPACQPQRRQPPTLLFHAPLERDPA